jgi:hypothetical protein
MEGQSIGNPPVKFLSAFFYNSVVIGVLKVHCSDRFRFNLFFVVSFCISEVLVSSSINDGVFHNAASY